MRTLSGTDHEFALCLTHDVDRPFKTPFHALFYTVRDRDPRHLRALLPDHDPYWQFDDITTLEADLGVRSAFYFLDQPSPREYGWRDMLDPSALVEEFGRYDVQDERIVDAIQRMDAGGWEVGLHGSYLSADDRDRLAAEKRRIERSLGDELRGGRQHYLRFEAPETWQHYRAVGLRYDASFGSPTECGFQHGYDVFRPFGDEFVVFPLTLMDQHLPDPGDRFDDVWATCVDLLDEAAAETAVMTVLFHPRLFATEEFPGFERLYRRLIESALERDAWVGSPGAFYDQFLTDGPPAESQRPVPGESG